MGTKNNPGKFDCYEKAGADEPLFVLRAEDPYAAIAVRLWVTLSEPLPPEKAAEALKCATDMDKFRDLQRPEQPK